jgi:hypothetical protein
MGKTFRREKTYFDDDYTQSYKNEKKKSKQLKVRQQKKAHYEENDYDENYTEDHGIRNR